MAPSEKITRSLPGSTYQERPFSYTISCDDTKDDETRKRTKFMALETRTASPRARSSKVELFLRVLRDSTQDAQDVGFQSESNPHEIKGTSLMYKELLDDMKIRESRKQDIERSCQLVDPPITPYVLRHTDAYKASMHILQPMTDRKWELLRRQLLAHLLATELLLGHGLVEGNGTIGVLLKRLSERLSERLSLRRGNGES